MSEKFEILDIDNNKVYTGSFDDCIDKLVEKYNDDLEFTTMCVIATDISGEVVAMIKHKNADIEYT